MRMNHIYIYGSNINELCDFYSYILDTEIVFDSAEPYFIFDQYKFVIKKLIGNYKNSLPLFSFSIPKFEEASFHKKIELYYYKNGVEFNHFKKWSNCIEYSDPCGNLFRLESDIDSERCQKAPQL